MTGFGIDVSARRILPSGWFTGLSYTGFFTDGSSSIGDPNTNSQSVLANLHDRSLANLILNTTFDDGVVDAAQETVEIKRHQGDLVLGREIRSLPWLGGSWHTGLRIAAIDVDRDVLYQDLSGANLLSAQTTLKSRMIGGGPTVGVASAFDMTGTGWMIKSGASASLLVSHFDLSRKDLQTTPTAAGFRNVEMTTYGMVPMLDATIELSKAFGNFQLGVGYRVSAAIGGARTILSTGNDDVFGRTSPYIIEKNDVINHGVFAKAGIVFGSPAPHPVADDAYGNGATVVFESKVYYAWGYLGGTPAYGIFTNPAAGTTINGLPVNIGASYNADFPSPGKMTGFGIDVNARRVMASGWFTGLGYTGFFTDDTAATGALNSTGHGGVFANLHDRSLANLILNTTFDDGVVDAAQETVEIKRHQGDLVLGREIQFLPWLGGSWHTGLRIAAIDVDRDVLYQDLSGANLLSAQTTLKSRMIGGGPTVGVASAFDMTGTGWMIKSGASASLLVSHFDLSRKDLQTTPTAAGFRNVEMTTYGMVPMLDATIELSKAFGNFQLGVGYRVSVAIGGARTILSIGNDDVDGTTSPYIVEKNDVINHGVFARAAMAFGPPVSRPVLDDAYTNGATIVFESKVYYAWGYLGGTPSYGTYANRAAGFIGGLPIVVAPSYNGDFASPGTMAGLGVELGARRILASGRFTGLSYTGFFTDDTSSTGALNNAGNAVLVNFLDRSLANLVVNGTFDNGEADTAQEAIKIKRHQGDLVLGRKTQLLPWLGGSWQAGLRAAAIEVDRDVLYQNLEGGTVRSAQTTLESRMIGAGPTIGVASAFDVMRTGWMIKSSASASLLVSHFDLSRNDLQLGAASAGFRNVDMSNYGVVPMLDATIELSKAFGNFQLGVGYRVSAALGGARTILTIGGDDVDGATSPYLIEKNDIINHGVFAKAGMVFGPAH